MAGGPTGGTAASTSSRSAVLFSTRNVLIGVAALIVLIAILMAGRYRSGSARRGYESLLTTSLDKIVTAEEGLYYDSTRYVASLRALPTVHLPSGVHVTLFSSDRKSWWGVATHDRLPAHHCVVWVGVAPPSLPWEARAPENETRPLCFDDKATIAAQGKHF